MKLHQDEHEPNVIVFSDKSCILQIDATFFTGDSNEDTNVVFKFPAKVIKIRGEFLLNEVVDSICTIYPHVLAIVVICKTIEEMSSLKTREELKKLHLLYFAIESEIEWVK